MKPLKYIFACSILLGASGSLSAAAQANAKPGAQQPTSTPVAAAISDPKYLAAMAEAKQLVHDRQYAFAMDKYKKRTRSLAAGIATA